MESKPKIPGSQGPSVAPLKHYRLSSLMACYVGHV